MPFVERIKGIAQKLKTGLPAFLRHLKTALLAFLRGLRKSRLAEGIGYVVAAIFVLYPIILVGQLLNWALARESAWVGYVVVATIAVCLLFFAALMTNEQFLRDVRLQGMKWPSLLSVALAWLAVVVFGGMSCGFERMGLVEIVPNVPFDEGCATRYADMYLWHLFDSIDREGQRN